MILTRLTESEGFSDAAQYHQFIPTMFIKLHNIFPLAKHEMQRKDIAGLKIKECTFQNTTKIKNAIIYIHINILIHAFSSLQYLCI